MTINFKYDTEHRVLIGKVSGSTSLDEVKGSMANLVESQEYPADVNTLWDLREMEFHNIDYQFGEKLLDFRKGIADKRRKAKVALLSVNELGRPLLEIYRIMSEAISQPTQIFSRPEEAMKWLCDDMDEAPSGR